MTGSLHRANIWNEVFCPFCANRLAKEACDRQYHDMLDSVARAIDNATFYGTEKPVKEVDRYDLDS